MLAVNNHAFKEWAVVCAALERGQQTIILRKGGIREEAGRFTVETPEFFLMPTYEHQNSELLKTEHACELAALQATALAPNTVTLSAYATVDAVTTAATEDQVRAIDPAPHGSYSWLFHKAL